MTRLPSQMSEDELLNCVLDLARLLRWRSYHIRNSRAGVTQGDVGYPDITLARGERLLFVELKRQSGKLTEGQEKWLEALKVIAAAKGVEVYLWRPDDWIDGTVEEVHT